MREEIEFDEEFSIDLYDGCRIWLTKASDVEYDLDLFNSYI